MSEEKDSINKENKPAEPVVSSDSTNPTTRVSTLDELKANKGECAAIFVGMVVCIVLFNLIFSWLGLPSSFS